MRWPEPSPHALARFDDAALALEESDSEVAEFAMLGAVSVAVPFPDRSEVLAEPRVPFSSSAYTDEVHALCSAIFSSGFSPPAVRRAGLALAESGGEDAMRAAFYASLLIASSYAAHLDDYSDRWSPRVGLALVGAARSALNRGWNGTGDWAS
jgi:hypothetical protein